MSSAKIITSDWEEAMNYYFTLFSDTQSELTNASLEEEDYLQREERILTLAREKYRRQCSKLHLTSTEEKIYSFSVKADMCFTDIVRHISKSFAVPLLLNMENAADQYAEELLAAVQFPGIEISLEILQQPDNSMRGRIPAGSGNKSMARIIHVTFTESGFAPMHIYGSAQLGHANILYRDGVIIADIADFFSCLILYTRVMAEIQRLTAVSAEDKKTDFLYQGFLSVVTRYQSRLCNSLFSDSSASATDSSPLTFEEIFSRKLYCYCGSPYLDNSICSLTGLANIQTAAAEEWNSFMLKSAGLPDSCFITRPEILLCSLAMAKDFYVSYHAFLCTNYSYKCNLFWALPHGVKRGRSKKIYDTALMDLFASFFRVIAEIKLEQKQTYSYLQELEKSHARSYQLKKDIPKKILSAMKSSGFNDFFGFVEFDEETDLHAVQEIEKEFRALHDTYFPHINSLDNAIRFRKLGHHKALGLYYPSVKCLCVDIRSPESLTHEYGHLIDYSLGSLSTQYAFSGIRSAYTAHLQNQMECNPIFRKRMQRRTYGIGYYSTPTEIFARSFELYVSKILAVRNSIVRETFDPDIYPQDTAFLNKVLAYFNSFFGPA